jgi:hypothetical protein
VIARLITRYNNPARMAYTYLFRLTSGGDFSCVIPNEGEVVMAWVDEGDGLEVAPVDHALRRCQAIQEAHITTSPAHKLTPHERRQMMARAIVFALDQHTDDLIVVHLISRSLTFTPKGDREVYEHWRLGGEGWYSAHRPQGNTTA